MRAFLTRWKAVQYKLILLLPSAREQYYYSYSSPALLQTLELSHNRKYYRPYQISDREAKESRAAHQATRDVTSLATVALGVPVLRTAPLIATSGSVWQQSFSAHAVPLEKDEKQENPGFVAGHFNVEQFPPEMVSSLLASHPHTMIGCALCDVLCCHLSLLRVKFLDKWVLARFATSPL